MTQQSCFHTHLNRQKIGTLLPPSSTPILSKSKKTTPEIAKQAVGKPNTTYVSPRETRYLAERMSSSRRYILGERLSGGNRHLKHRAPDVTSVSNIPSQRCGTWTTNHSVGGGYYTDRSFPNNRFSLIVSVHLLIYCPTSI